MVWLQAFVEKKVITDVITNQKCEFLKKSVKKNTFDIKIRSNRTRPIPPPHVWSHTEITQDADSRGSDKNNPICPVSEVSVSPKHKHVL